MMNHVSLTATYTSHSQTQDRVLQKQVSLSAPVNARLPTPSSDSNADTNANTAPKTDSNLKEHTESKHHYLSALRSAASQVQDDINALLTAEMQADKIRDMAATSDGDGEDNAMRKGRLESKQIERESQGKAKGNKFSEMPDDVDDNDLEDESDEDV